MKQYSRGSVEPRVLASCNLRLLLLWLETESLEQKLNLGTLRNYRVDTLLWITICSDTQFSKIH